MKKGAYICLTIFSSLSLIALILLIYANVTARSFYNNCQDLFIASEALILVSIIGTFVSSIVCLAKCKHFQRKGLIKASSIVGIVGSSIGFIFATPVIASPGFASIGILPMLSIPIILLIISFGISVGAVIRINREIKSKSC